MGRKASFAANSMAIGKKNNENGEPEPALPQTAGSCIGHLSASQIRLDAASSLGQVPARLDDLAQSGFQSSNESVTCLQQRQNVRE